MAQDRIIKIDLGLTRADFAGRTKTAQLELKTDKGFRGGVRAAATVFWVGFQMKEHAFGMGGPGGDFSKTIATAEGKATQANIDRVHAKAFTPVAIEEIKAQALAHYAPNPEQERRERAARENQAAMGAAVKELTDSGIDASTALRMLNID